MKRPFHLNTFIFCLLLAALLHGLVFFLSPPAVPVAVPSPETRVAITLARLTTPAQPPGQIEPVPFTDPVSAPKSIPRPVEAGQSREVTGSVVTARPAGSPVSRSDKAAEPSVTPAGEATGIEQQVLLSETHPLWEKLKHSLTEALIYPPLARKRGMQGLALLAFELDTSGQLKQVQLVRSTGYELLDKAALAAIRRIIPFKHGLGQSICVQIPLRYRLEK